MSDKAQERRDCWDAATYIVSLVVRPDGEGLQRMDELGQLAVESALEHPDLMRQLVTAFAIFASELPRETIRSALDRLADDEGSSRG